MKIVKPGEECHKPAFGGLTQNNFLGFIVPEHAAVLCVFQIVSDDMPDPGTPFFTHADLS